MGEIKEVTLYRPKGLRFWQRARRYGKGPVLDDKRHGKWVFWYESGAVQLEGEYVEGEKHGLWTKWWEDGGKWAQGKCLHGRMDGKWIEWHRNGQKARESYWVRGKKDGEWKYWDPEGKLKETESYDYRTEKTQEQAVCTDLEARQMIKEIQRNALHRNWEKMVGRPLARLVKPWHIACWVLLFIIGLGLTKDGSRLEGIALAAIIAFLITSLLGWVYDGEGSR